LLRQPMLVGATFLIIVVGNALAASTLALVFRYPLQMALALAASLAQIGEFSFILADRGLDLHLLNPNQYQAFLATAVLTIAVTPVLIGAGPRLADRLDSLPMLKRWQGRRAQSELAGERVAARGHVVIVGYGLNGRNLARVLRAADIPYVVLELNPATVRQARLGGEPVHYGDCTRPAVLEHLGVANARMFVVAISDPASSRRAVLLARRLNRNLQILVRTRYLSEVAELRRLGANAIIPEEFETSVEIFARVLREYEVPRNLIMNLTERVRAEHYEVLRDRSVPTMRVVLPHREVLEQLETGSCWIRDNSPAVGQTVGEMRLRSVTGATLVAARRAGSLQLNPGPDFRFQADDTVVLIGDRSQLNKAMCLLDPNLEQPPLS